MFERKSLSPGSRKSFAVVSYERIKPKGRDSVVTRAAYGSCFDRNRAINLRRVDFEFIQGEIFVSDWEESGRNSMQRVWPLISTEGQ